ncbi:MAG: DUF192 domain-containing protein [Dehalococcoidia bacterium]
MSAQPALTLAALFLLAGCGASHAAGQHAAADRVAVVHSGSVATVAASPETVAQTPASALPIVTFITASKVTQKMAVEIADTPASQEIGLMSRPSLPDDQGMIFIFSRENLTPFWMKDTEIDLSIAFIDANGVIVDIQEMQAYSLDNHDPAAPYQYAIEANAHWYDRHGVHIGDMTDVSQAVAASPVYGSGTATPSP